MQGQTDLRSLVRRGVGSAHKLPRDASSVPCLSILLAGHKGTPCASTLRQQVRGVIHKSPGLSACLEAPLHAGERPSCLGSGKMNACAVMGPACVATQREPFDLPEYVLITTGEARALSIRRLYALKWSVFSAWCQNRDLDPVTSDVSVVLSFLQEMLDKQCSSSTIKVYTAAIAAFNAPIAGWLVGRNSAVVQFLWGTRRINPPCTVAPWDLPTVLRALKAPRLNHCNPRASDDHSHLKLACC